MDDPPREIDEDAPVTPPESTPLLKLPELELPEPALQPAPEALLPARELVARGLLDVLPTAATGGGGSTPATLPPLPEGGGGVDIGCSSER